jgi:transcriptional regulator with PAS, ATPase and Fis domain
VLQQQRLRKRQEVVARERQGSLNPFLGESEAIRTLEQQAKRMLAWDSPILILGETGTGKGVLAHWIHSNSPRAEEAFVNLNCAGLPRELLESELFGHERGAFTGAVNAKKGLLEVGHRGIIFLDEIGDMDPAIQPRLLKALEEKTFRRLGDVRDRVVDIRLIASTNLGLEEMVRARTFRDDLYYRISTLTLRIPPLRERPKDILMLAQEILQGVCARMGKPEIQISPAAEAALLHYAWPGNIREMSNVLERAMVLQRGACLEEADLGLEHGREAVPAGDGELATMKEMERSHIERVLQRTGGNVAEAAQILGMARRTLYDRIKALNLVLDKD